jgi:UDP-N-acetylmuramoyl-tripeptide--D-alanyl-D-alanine ligase
MRVIADCYNANPASVNAAVDILAAVPAEGEKIAVLGTMRELGVSSQRLHREVAEQAFGRLGAGIDRLVATGEFVDAFAALPRAAADDRVIVAADPMEGYEAIAGSLRGDETILLKASRGEALERWIDRLESRQDPQTESH